MVYVISCDGEQLSPCSNVIARLLLKQKKAKVKKKDPFTIKLLYKIDPQKKIIDKYKLNQSDKICL